MNCGAHEGLDLFNYLSAENDDARFILSEIIIHSVDQSNTDKMSHLHILRTLNKHNIRGDLLNNLFHKTCHSEMDRFLLLIYGLQQDSAKYVS